jgi:hypothetical protein
MIPAGLSTDSENKSLIGMLRADARAARDAERAERATTVTVAETVEEAD